jgi:hypothetical protein
MFEREKWVGFQHEFQIVNAKMQVDELEYWEENVYLPNSLFQIFDDAMDNFEELLNTVLEKERFPDFFPICCGVTQMLPFVLENKIEIAIIQKIDIDVFEIALFRQDASFSICHVSSLQHQEFWDMAQESCTCHLTTEKLFSYPWSQPKKTDANFWVSVIAWITRLPFYKHPDIFSNVYTSVLLKKKVVYPYTPERKYMSLIVLELLMPQYDRNDHENILILKNFMFCFEISKKIIVQQKKDFSKLFSHGMKITDFTNVDWKIDLDDFITKKNKFSLFFLKKLFR